MRNTLNKILKCGSGLSLVFLFLLAGCNSKTEKSVPPKTDTVVIDQMKFIPDTLSVNKGDTVMFINKDIVAHNATEVNNQWVSPNLNTGEFWKTVPDTSTDYYCSIHMIMKGKINVK